MTSLPLADLDEPCLIVSHAPRAASLVFAQMREGFSKGRVGATNWTVVSEGRGQAGNMNMYLDVSNGVVNLGGLGESLAPVKNMCWRLGVVCD